MKKPIASTAAKKESHAERQPRAKAPAWSHGKAALLRLPPSMPSGGDCNCGK
jgi:hypothetical protein